MIEKQVIRVLVADDHAVVRGGLVHFLSTQSDIELVGEATTSEQAVQMCVQFEPDIVVMDMKMPEMGGLDATRAILKQHPQIRIIALTSFEEEKLVEEALKAGVTSYLVKDTAARDLVNAIRSTHEGKSVVSPQIIPILVQRVRKPASLGADLTEREREVLKAMTAGASNNDIAERLSISPNTVRFHVRGILAKLQAKNRTEAVSIALSENIVPSS